MKLRLLTVVSLWWLSQPAWGAGGVAQSADRAIDRGLHFLEQRQDEQGTFAINRCNTAAMTDCAREMPVSGAIIGLHALWSLKGPVAQRIRERAAKFLLQEQSRAGLWRYMPRSGGYRSYLPDLDDTAIAALALRRAGYSMPADHTKRLLAYRNTEGLFPTYVPSEDRDTAPAADERCLQRLQSVDCGVNANVLAYLASAGDSAPAVCMQLREAVGRGVDRACTPYYPSLPAFAHLISRAYETGAVCLREAMPVLSSTLVRAQQSDGTWGPSPSLDTALALVALLSAGYRGKTLDDGIEALVARQQRDGGWPAELYYTGAPVSCFYGSEEVTTAFALEALGRFVQSNREPGKRL